MRRRGVQQFLVLCAAALTSVSVHAQTTIAAESRVVESRDRSTTGAELDERLANEWQLNLDEWARYRELMRGPLGIYAPNLDPLTALGIEARTDDERRRYAELQVKAEARRVEKLLSYQRAYDTAWQRLYPKLQRVELADAHATAETSVGARLAVFVKDACTPCEQRVRQLQAAGTTFDVYVVGSRQDDARVRQWAAKAGIEPQKVRAGTITLNHDAGRWLAIGVQGELPAVVREIDGQWQRF
jgi:integrating conjugative element protein (TIGR03759 family)